MNPFTVACVQVNAGADMSTNLAEAARLVRGARAAGADLILTPENVSLMAAKSDATRAAAMTMDGNPALTAFRDLASATGAWLLAGSLPVRVAGDERIANRSILIDPAGSVSAWYDKVHMFDVDIPGGESHRESRTFRPGGQAVVADTPWGPLGLSVCYDLRFAYLYRTLAQHGAHYLTIPSAFTAVSGAAHWHVLMRARAIETGAFVFAPAQCGTHPGGRRTFGHSLIVDPWGVVLADAGEEPGFVVAEVDPARIATARAAIPALSHDRPVSPPVPLRLAGE